VRQFSVARRSNLHSARQLPYPTSRAFLHWRLSDDGPGASRIVPIGRHPKPLYEREVVKGLSARLRSRVVSFCLAPLQSPYPFVPTRNISTPSRAGPVKDGRRAVRATCAEFPGHSLTGLSTMAGSGASGSLSPPAELVL
jgi:hypothetical protein